MPSPFLSLPRLFEQFCHLSSHRSSVLDFQENESGHHLLQSVKPGFFPFRAVSRVYSAEVDFNVICISESHLVLEFPGCRPREFSSQIQELRSISSRILERCLSEALLP